MYICTETYCIVKVDSSWFVNYIIFIGLQMVANHVHCVRVSCERCAKVFIHHLSHVHCYFMSVNRFFFTQWVCIYSFLSEKNSKMSLKKFKRKLKYWVFVFYLKLLMHFYHELLVVPSFILCWKADGTILISSCWKCWQLTRYWLLITTEKWTCIWNGSDIPAHMIAWPYFGAD